MNISKISRGTSNGNKEHNSVKKNAQEKSEIFKASGRQGLIKHIAEVLLFTGPWSTSFNISITNQIWQSVQKSTEGDPAAEQMWRPGEHLPKCPVFASLKNSTAKGSGSSQGACAQKKGKVL